MTVDLNNILDLHLKYLRGESEGVRANLSGANLSGANLSGAIGLDLALAKCSFIPSEGAFVGWKKCMNGVIVKIQIPAKAKRSHGAERKCRAEFVKVLEVFGALEAISGYDKKTIYRKGLTVKADGWDDDRWNTCAPGIHFFLTREEAEAYSL